MTIEEKVFGRKRFVIDLLEPAGFLRTEAGFELYSDFMDGDFSATLFVPENGPASGKVIDNMNGEEYLPLRVDNYSGAYVNSVRAAYEKLLSDIAEKCCVNVMFVSDQANRITDSIFDRYSVSPDFPWGQGQYESYGTFRHPENNKWFALIMDVKWNVLLKNGDASFVDIVNLKIEPSTGEELRKIPGIYPAYHMNHKNWISVTLDDRLTDEEVMSLIDSSFMLTGHRDELP